MGEDERWRGPAPVPPNSGMPANDELAAGRQRRLQGRLGPLGQFAIASAVCVVLLGVVMGTVLQRIVEDRALERAETLAHSIGQLAILPLFEPEDFTVGRIEQERIAQLDEQIAAALATQEVSRVKVFGRGGTVVYSDEHELIGSPFNPGVEKDVAFAGGVASKLRDPRADDEHATEADLGRLLEVYHPLPMVVDGEERIVGAMEVYFPYEPVAAAIERDERLLFIVLIAGLVVLWAALFQIVARASRTLRQHAERNRYLALHDRLTGLANRMLFTDRTQQAIASARRDDTDVAVLLIDLDRFQDVNDTLGHTVGDELLRAVAQRILDQVREADTVARIGGDEFAVLMPRAAAEGPAIDLAERILRALRQPFLIESVTLEVDASIGVAGFPAHANDAEQLLRCSDLAMHQAKTEQSGIGSYLVGLDDNAPSRVALFGELRRAIDHGELIVHYQPKVDVAAARVAGVEALVRWAHPDRGTLYPDVFLGLAERTGLIRPLTWFVLERAIADCSTWRGAGLDLTVAVNLSARNLLDPTLGRQVRELLDRHGLPPSALELEITESSAMLDPESSLRVLADLHDAGITLAVDDYGTGHSSLAYLSRLPVDQLKIDRSFVMSMLDDDKDEAIVRSTIDLGRQLGLEVVAEGVECADAYARLRDLGCDAAQGYWLARPAPDDTVVATVAELGTRLDRTATTSTAEPAGHQA